MVIKNSDQMILDTSGIFLLLIIAIMYLTYICHVTHVVIPNIGNLDISRRFHRFTEFPQVYSETKTFKHKNEIILWTNQVMGLVTF